MHSTCLCTKNLVLNSLPAEDGMGASLRMAGRMGSCNSISSAEASAAARIGSPLELCAVGDGKCSAARNKHMLCAGQSMFAKHFCSLVWFCLNLRQVNLLKDGSELMLLLTVRRPGSHVLPCLPLLVHSSLHCARGAEPVPGASNIPGRPHIYPMPENPLELLRQLHGLLKASHSLTASCCCVELSFFTIDVLILQPCPSCSPWARVCCPLSSLQLLVDQLRQKCLEEPRSDDRPRGFSALTQDPKECVQEVRCRHALVFTLTGPCTENTVCSLNGPFQAGPYPTDGTPVCRYSPLLLSCGLARPTPAYAFPNLPLQEGKPCSGEKLLLMFDRWRKLAKAFFSEKKNQFDISKASTSSIVLPAWAGFAANFNLIHDIANCHFGSSTCHNIRATLQVPDIYDAAKYDAIHNQHLGLDLRPVYKVGWQPI